MSEWVMIFGQDHITWINFLINSVLTREFLRTRSNLVLGKDKDVVLKIWQKHNTCFWELILVCIFISLVPLIMALAPGHIAGGGWQHGHCLTRNQTVPFGFCWWLILRACQHRECEIVDVVVAVAPILDFLTKRLCIGEGYLRVGSCTCLDDSRTSFANSFESYQIDTKNEVPSRACTKGIDLLVAVLQSQSVRAG